MWESKRNHMANLTTLNQIFIEWLVDPRFQRGDEHGRQLGPPHSTNDLSSVRCIYVDSDESESLNDGGRKNPPEVDVNLQAYGGVTHIPIESENNQDTCIWTEPPTTIQGQPTVQVSHILEEPNNT